MAHGPEMCPVCLLSFVPFLEQSDLGPGKPCVVVQRSQWPKEGLDRTWEFLFCLQRIPAKRGHPEESRAFLPGGFRRKEKRLSWELRSSCEARLKGSLSVK